MIVSIKKQQLTDYAGNTGVAEETGSGYGYSGDRKVNGCKETGKDYTDTKE